MMYRIFSLMVNSEFFFICNTPLSSLHSITISSHSFRIIFNGISVTEMLLLPYLLKNIWKRN